MKDLLIAFFESYQRMGALPTTFLFGYYLLVLFVLALVGGFAVALVGIVLYYFPKPGWITEFADKLKFGTHPNVNRQNLVPASWIRFLGSHR